MEHQHRNPRHLADYSSTDDGCQKCQMKEKELADLKAEYELQNKAGRELYDHNEKLIAKYRDLKELVITYAKAKKMLNSQKEFAKMMDAVHGKGGE
jgi:hypothetical protein